MSNTDGLLINNNNIYGLVNPPPPPTSGDKAKGYQDISSAAVRWDSFVDLSSTVVDLSNSQLTVIQASPYFNSIIDRVPYNTVYGTQNFLLYPLYQQGQIVFTQDKTFTKMRLYLKGRNGKIAGFKHLGDLLPGDIPTITGVQNWAEKDCSGVIPVQGNRDGDHNYLMYGYNAGTTGPFSSTNGDTGICQGQTAANNGGFDVYDISGPTKLADNGSGANYTLYENIDINGWNLGFRVFITETDPSGNQSVLGESFIWDPLGTPTNQGGIVFYYNPKAYAIIMGTNAQQNPSGRTPTNPQFTSPQLTKNKTTNNTRSNYTLVKDAIWNQGASNFTYYGHLMHSVRSEFQGNNLYYIEVDLGAQTNFSVSVPPFPLGVSDWTDRPVTFKKNYSYLVNVQMENLYEPIPKSSSQNGPGLGLVDALTYFELIV
tara:strand:- start:1354 stop:2640 length:1287 start_codon:yes stop_codon:yes gene_type:complete